MEASRKPQGRWAGRAGQRRGRLLVEESEPRPLRYPRIMSEPKRMRYPTDGSEPTLVRPGQD
jgi:hypothetical protein